MRKPQFVTITGIDDRTDLNQVKRISKRFPVEWGVLMSTTPNQAKYPSEETIESVISLDLPISAHLCGLMSEQFQSGIVFRSISEFHRVQVNSTTTVDTKFFQRYKDTYNIQIIIQSRSEEEFIKSTLVHQLFDRSNGTGIFPSKVPELPDFFVGYSGGITPDNVAEYLSKIRGSHGPFWIDVESGVRTDGWLDLDKVETLLEKVYL